MHKTRQGLAVAVNPYDIISVKETYYRMLPYLYHGPGAHMMHQIEEIICVECALTIE